MNSANCLYLLPMTMWLPKLESRRGPVYRAIADALDEDVQNGALRAGMRLPPHRDLADHLGVTVTTITRAYAEAARRGLTSGYVGRGTFIRGNEAEERSSETAPFDLSVTRDGPCARAKEVIEEEMSHDPRSGTQNAVLRSVGRIDGIKHDVDVLERVLSMDEEPRDYEAVHMDVVDLQIHPSLRVEPQAHNQRSPRSPRPFLSLVKDRRERS